MSRPPTEPPRSGHRLISHTADVIVEAWGMTLGECLTEASRALIETYCEAPLPDPTTTIERTIDEVDETAALESVLEEIIFVLDTSDATPVACDVSVDPIRIRIGLADRRLVRSTGAVPKAISRSGLAVERDDLIRCRFLVDV